MAPGRLFRAPQHPSARTEQQCQWAAAKHQGGDSIDVEQSDRLVGDESLAAKHFMPFDECMELSGDEMLARRPELGEIAVASDWTAAEYDHVRDSGRVPHEISFIGETRSELVTPTFEHRSGNVVAIKSGVRYCMKLRAWGYEFGILEVARATFAASLGVEIDWQVPSDLDDENEPASGF
jgi:hypothetical protein